METWTQIYAPLGSLGLSALVASLPIIFFFIALAVLRMKGHVAGTITVAIALAIAVLVYQMPVDMAFAAAGYGFLYGLWPIAWIIVCSVFLYKVTVKTGQFDIIRASVLSITEDQRLQMLLVGFSFGAFLEGAAGFGAPVAITAALLVGLGFNPLYAAGLCLIANTAPVAFGAMGIPILVAGKVTSIDPFLIGKMAGHQLPLLSVIVPFWLVFMMDGFRGIRQTWPAILVAGGSFAVTQFFTASYVGPELPDITSALVSLICLTVFLKVWHPKENFRFANDGTTKGICMPRSGKAGSALGFTGGQVFKAWTPFIILTAMVTVWSLKPFKMLFDKGGPLAGLVFKWEVPHLHNLVIKAAPIVASAKPYEAIYKLDILSATGTAILISALISIALLRMKPADAARTFAEVVLELKRPIYSIGMVLAFAFVANYSGLSSTLALVLAGTGALFPFFSPFLGWLGVFLTGSDTSSNALFCGMQRSTAEVVGMDPALAVSANSSGGVTGKMISPQSISVATAATNLVGHEGDLFRFTLGHSLAMTAFICVLTYLQSNVLHWMLP